MKSLIVLVVGLLAIGCASTPYMKSKIAGTYKGRSLPRGIGDGRMQTFLLSNKRNIEGARNFSASEWKVVGQEVHVNRGNNIYYIYRINPDAANVAILSLTLIGYKDPYRRPQNRHLQTTWKKIK